MKISLNGYIIWVLPGEGFYDWFPNCFFLPTSTASIQYLLYYFLRKTISPIRGNIPNWWDMFFSHEIAQYDFNSALLAQL